ncbi:YkyA family protein [Metabacillus iocasae]|uniref:DNA repair exonuclease SbcCD ATPase subunit n=1 Tax=Priestia iocasae TaxID=2291674 RepID=A0ABS2QVF6_9BACI|nr:YkyA family protein [Metabacillus iocasae]MBM7703385.1 DNA repair exonuclease SbcCD ATPase subunit [Metabacillus iocasae]
MKKYVVVGALVSGLLAGCSNDSVPELAVYESFEKVVAEEKAFSSQQRSLTELEQKEKDMYDEIISLGMKEHERVKKVANQALKIVNEREERLEKESKSIKKSYQKSKEIQSQIETIENPQFKKDAEQLISMMDERYEAYEKLYGFYKQGLQLDKELYQLFQNEKVTLDELEDKITSINATYENIIKANEQFNNKTYIYNEKKQQFYEKVNKSK